MIVDLPAAIEPELLYDLTYDANSILVPINPSEIDVYSAARFIADLLLVAQLHLRDHRLGIIANRARANTRSYRMLMRFLNSLQIPVVTELRDSQAYVAAAAQGMGVYDLPPHRVRKDIESMEGVVDWLDKWRIRKLDAVAPAGFEHVAGTQVFTPAHSRGDH